MRAYNVDTTVLSDFCQHIVDSALDQQPTKPPPTGFKWKAIIKVRDGAESTQTQHSITWVALPLDPSVSMEDQPTRKLKLGEL